MAKQYEPSAASLAIFDTSKTLRGENPRGQWWGNSVGAWVVNGVSHEQVRSDLAKLSLGDFVLSRGQSLTRDLKRYKADRYYAAAADATTNLPPKDITISTGSTGNRDKDWNASVGLTLWYSLGGGYLIGEKIKIDENYIPEIGSHPQFRGSIGVPEKDGKDWDYLERLVRPPKDDAQAIKFLELILSYRKKGK